ncbi:putative major sperm protein 1 [Trichinella spiralis]|uniref:putative major sperm protein 1 n=1 Tax=Trichinella spiralis TaxID=6334 RepID=UPI0001EFC050|nr:putative major sperm protein 1 [Trichinella spiralis]
MALPTDIVSVPAEEVWFNAPCLSEQVTALKLSNPGKKLLGYRVVSKVENRYVVLPSQGALQPKKDITINIICHPFPFRSESPPVDTLIIEWVDAFEGETDFNEDCLFYPVSSMLLEKTGHAKREIHFKQTLMFPLIEFNSMLLHM